MATAVVARAAGEVLKDVARLTGHLLNEGTTTAGTTTSATDATNERTPVNQANRVIGTYIYGESGDAAGEAHEITTYGTIGVMGWQTAGTSPGTNTKWLRLSLRPQAILDAMAAVTRAAAKLQALPYTFEGIITNNLLGHYLSGQEWDNGTTSAPTGTTMTNATIAREASIVGFGQYSGALTGSSAVGTLTRVVPSDQVLRLDAQSLILKGRIAETTAADGVVRVTTTDTANATTDTDRTGTYTSAIWEELKDISEAAVNLTDPSGELQVQVRAKNGVAVYFNDIGLYGPTIYDYDLPATMIGAMAEIDVERSYATRQYALGVLKRGQGWEVVKRDSTLPRTLHLNRALPSELHLRIHGLRAPDVVSTATSNVEPNPEWLALATAIYLLRGNDPGGRLPDYRAEMDRMFQSDTGNPWRHDHPVWFESR